MKKLRDHLDEVVLGKTQVRPSLGEIYTIIGMDGEWYWLKELDGAHSTISLNAVGDWPIVEDELDPTTLKLGDRLTNGTGTFVFVQLVPKHNEPPMIVACSDVPNITSVWSYPHVAWKQWKKVK